jgi:hypothetical protein
MKMREFHIHTENFDLGYTQNELTLGVIEEHLFEELDVPEEHVKKLELLDDSLYIQLTDKARYFNEDWYVNIQRIA